MGGHLCSTYVALVSHLCCTYVPPMSHLCPTYVALMLHLCPTYVAWVVVIARGSFEGVWAAWCCAWAVIGFGRRAVALE